MITSVQNYKVEGNDWRTFKKEDDARNYEREELLEKFLASDRSPDYSYAGKRYSTWHGTWIDLENADRIRSAKSDGWYNGRSEALSKFIKFYPEIMAGLKAIDEQKVDEVKA